MVLMDLNLYQIPFMRSACEILQWELKDDESLAYLESYCKGWAPGDFKFKCWVNPEDNTWLTGVIVRVCWPDTDQAVQWALEYT
jgi:hypothetical protein